MKHLIFRPNPQIPQPLVVVAAKGVGDSRLGVHLESNRMSVQVQEGLTFSTEPLLERAARHPIISRQEDQYGLKASSTLEVMVNSTASKPVISRASQTFPRNTPSSADSSCLLF